jgi:hypothetical protein
MKLPVSVVVGEVELLLVELCEAELGVKIGVELWVEVRFEELGVDE